MFGFRTRVKEVPPTVHTFYQLPIGKKFKKFHSNDHNVYEKTDEFQYEKPPENSYTAIKWFLVKEDFDIEEA